MARLSSVLNIGTVLVGVLWRSVLKRAAVEHASLTLGNSHSYWVRMAVCEGFTSEARREGCASDYKIIRKSREEDGRVKVVAQ